MNFSKLSNDELHELLAARTQHARNIDAERAVLEDEIAEIQTVLSDRKEQVAA
ncbi:hypothetical protein [Tolumonas lignilytica]|uniref:hypothetical protein n=1 Tax=Tolumonas lignilytica TaxID=1283284 RepID=UPI0004B2F8AB|nr:hypothetical protein [Tolumonas lignilytica]